MACHGVVNNLFWLVRDMMKVKICYYISPEFDKLMMPFLMTIEDYFYLDEGQQSGQFSLLALYNQ